MATVGIICEYNPFHLGHAKQFRLVREHLGADTAICCLMSGNYVQRGTPAMFDRLCRARAAVACGADLVLELPVLGSLCSAEGFARTGVEILSGLCDYLSFGTESGSLDALLATAEALLSPSFSPALRQALSTGVSFPVARAMAMEALGSDASLLRRPNDILAVEYTKAIVQLGSKMKPLPVQREGDYHAIQADRENPSATAVRDCILRGQEVSAYLPDEAAACFRNASVHTLQAGERAVLYRLRTMAEEDFAGLPYGSEGLWRRLMHACRRETTLEDIFTVVKTKRYPRTRLNRMVLCAFLGITEEILAAPAPYTRILAFNRRGREVLKAAAQPERLVNLGQRVDVPYGELEDRCQALYPLFCLGEIPSRERQRVISL